MPVALLNELYGIYIYWIHCVLVTSGAVMREVWLAVLFICFVWILFLLNCEGCHGSFPYISSIL